jgi:polyphosphate kinase
MRRKMTSESKQTRPDLDDASLYINRELSWLAFNARVLDQAADRDWPLLERVKFLAIFASNLDEFFMIRVSGLHEQQESEVTERTPDGFSADEQLERIGMIVREQMEFASMLYARELVPALADQGVRLHAWSSLPESVRRSARSYFRESVFPVLTPLAVDPVHPFPFLSNLSLSLAVEVADPVTEERRFARVKVPESLPRFVPIDGEPGDAPSAESRRQFDLLPLEELIANNLSDLFPGMKVEGCFPFRVTRDMDLDILEQEADDLLSVVDRHIRRRRFGAPVRLEVSPGLPEHIRDLLLDKLEIGDEDVYEYPGLLGLSGLFDIAQLARPELHDAPFVARTPVQLAEQPDLFAAIRAADVLLHHPYDSFGPVLDFVRRAADDPDVLAIKMTLYRAGSNAEVLRTLVHAAENGKQVAVSIELKARFDEERNIAWARSLERAGVHVFYSEPAVKTHAKVLLVVRREGSELRRYVHISTGNYNASTAKLYTDLGLFTADPAIGEDASELFNALSGFSRNRNYRKFAVAPVSLRTTLLAKIDAQRERAKAGRPARIFAKVNALVDIQIIRALYAASESGVEIDLVIRGICCLRPGIPGVSERIRVQSLIGRFLEHARAYVFGPEGEEEFFISSADWMPRNLDRRVEVLVPITCERARARIRHECLASVAHDNCRVYEMRADGVYIRRRPQNGESPSDAQLLALSSPERAEASKRQGLAASMRRRVMSARAPGSEAKTAENGVQGKPARTREPATGGAQST